MGVRATRETDEVPAEGSPPLTTTLPSPRLSLVPGRTRDSQLPRGDAMQKHTLARRRVASETDSNAMRRLTWRASQQAYASTGEPIGLGGRWEGGRTDRVLWAGSERSDRRSVSCSWTTGLAPRSLRRPRLPCRRPSRQLAATASVTCFARSLTPSGSPSPMSQLPMPTATPPALIHSPAVSAETPPVGTSGIDGNGPASCLR